MEKNNKWYHFGRWIQPILSTSPWLELSRTDAFKRSSFDFIKTAKYLKGDLYFLKSDLDKVSQFTEERITKNRKWFDYFFLLCSEKVKEILEYKNKNNLEGFFKAFFEALNCSQIVELLDYGLEKYLEKLYQKNGILVADVLSVIKPYKKTLLMKYQEELGNLKEEDIPFFVKKWEWVGTHLFTGTGLNNEKIRKEISETSSKKDQSHKKINLPEEYKEIIKIGSRLAFYRSYLVEVSNIVSYKYWPVLKKLAKNNGLSWDDLLSLTHEEIIKLEKEKAPPLNYKKRQQAYGVMNINDEIIVVVGEELKKHIAECQEERDLENITEIKGMIACKSRNKVRGIVKVIEEAKNMPKLKKGDILVANETTPDYVIGMKIAGAIITNQGGITSHAAIVSRELGIPCIIGTKIATKVLKDGDLVEVDANKGFFKILKRK